MMSEAGPYDMIELLLGALWGRAPLEPSHRAVRRHTTWKRTKAFGPQNACD